MDNLYCLITQGSSGDNFKAPMTANYVVVADSERGVREKYSRRGGSLRVVKIYRLTACQNVSLEERIDILEQVIPIIR